MWVGGILISTIATSGRGQLDLAQQFVGVSDLADDLDAGLGEQAVEPFAEEQLHRRRSRRAWDLRADCRGAARRVFELERAVQRAEAVFEIGQVGGRAVTLDLHDEQPVA